MKKILIASLICTSAFAGWFGNPVESTLENVKDFQCKKLEESIKSDLNFLQADATKDAYAEAIMRVERNIPLMGSKCNKEYNDVLPLLRDVREIVMRTAENKSNQ